MLRPGGILGLIWNLRDETVAWVGRLTEIMTPSNAERMLAAGPPEVDDPFGALESRTWRWERQMTRAEIVELMRSRSPVITASEGERARMEREVGALLDEIGAVGDATLAMPYETRAFRARRG